MGTWGEELFVRYKVFPTSPPPHLLTSPPFYSLAGAIALEALESKTQTETATQLTGITRPLLPIYQCHDLIDAVTRLPETLNCFQSRLPSGDHIF